MCVCVYIYVVVKTIDIARKRKPNNITSDNQSLILLVEKITGVDLMRLS